MLDSASMTVISRHTSRDQTNSTRTLISSISLALLSGFLLNLPFPIAGPLPPWRAVFGWIALVPLLSTLLAPANAARPNYLRRSALTAYLCGIFWYVLNCYWIYQTMNLYAHVPPAGAVGILILYSAVLGLYFGLFGLLIALLRRVSGGLLLPLALAPFLWVAIELAAARITSVPWDQLGYSQVDNFLLTRLAPFTGTYGISFVLVVVNALFAAALLAPSIHLRLRIGVGTALAALLLQLGSWLPPKPEATSNYAVLLQPNLSVGEDNIWSEPEWNEMTAWMLKESLRTCTPGYGGMPNPAARLESPACNQNVPPPGIVAWPEAPSPFVSDEPRVIALLGNIAKTADAPLVAGMFGHDDAGTYNSGVVTAPDGTALGRYDKIHLVPFGEFVPYREVFFFAHKLTQQLVDLQRGSDRKVFRADGRTFGIFICYESVFADEVRHFALNGAQVLLNISDDGWYGDTSAPWQHLNMARMRAIENHRWILRDANNGVTTSIDPHGRVTLSAPRHVLTSLVARYGYENDLTFYTRHGDLFAYACGIIVLGVVAFAVTRQRPFQR
jgi:apolipoprotein N-acyltransferase